MLWRMAIQAFLGRSMLGLAVLATFLLNPAVACSSSSEADFEYGASELRTAVEGNWVLTSSDEGGSSSSVELRIEQATQAQPTTSRGQGPRSARAWVREASACGTRTLIRSANACVDLTEMPLTVSYVAGDSKFEEVALSGQFSVLSRIFQQGELQLQLGELHISASVSPDGRVQTVRALPASTVSLQRLP